MTMKKKKKKQNNAEELSIYDDYSMNDECVDVNGL